ncbi:hypothetical protein CPB86DRAFT_340011 [Serendipita vermifera]|nr:hypothetical protein CPB86DRAFT_340011 [Serendipita vermifera]
MELAVSQRKTTSLHLCARGGEYAAEFGEALLKALLPASKWDHKDEKPHQEDHATCNETCFSRDDPLVDCRDEYDQTPFFLALKNEEYKLSHVFIQAGANKNALIAHPQLHQGNPIRVAPGIDGLPIAEHALSWVSAYRALRFLIQDCHGCLRLTNSYGDELRTVAIEETANWPVEEASIVLGYIMQHAYPKFTWDSHLVMAIQCLNESAVAMLVRNRRAIPQHSTPEVLYDTARERLLGDTADTIEGHAETCSRVLNILHLIRDSYPNHGLGGSCLPEYPDRIISAVQHELVSAKERHLGGVIGFEKLLNEVDKILAPWVMVICVQTAPHQLEEVQSGLQKIMGDEVNVEWYLDNEGNGICGRRTELKGVQSPQPSLTLVVPGEVESTSSGFRNWMRNTLKKKLSSSSFQFA